MPLKRTWTIYNGWTVALENWRLKNFENSDSTLDIQLWLCTSSNFKSETGFITQSKDFYDDSDMSLFTKHMNYTVNRRDFYSNIENSMQLKVKIR